jgi:hypothetical protein
MAHNNGNLACEAHDGAVYCHHIEQVIEKGWDTEPLWSFFQGSLGKPGYGMICSVPIAGEYDLWIVTNLVTTEMKHALEIQGIGPDHSWLEVSHADSSIIFDGDPFFLGYLNKGEGRRVLREILDNWLFTQPNGQCKNRSHSFAAQLDYEKRQKTPEGRRICWWFYVLTGQCPECVIGEGADISDLVPDAGEPKRPWS